MAQPSTARRFSYVLVAGVFVASSALHMGALLLTTLLSLVALEWVHFTKARWPAVVIFLVAIVGVGYGAVHFLRATIAALPQIADSSLPALIAWATAHNIQLPFEDYDGLKRAVTDGVQNSDYIGNAATMAKNGARQLVLIIVGMVAGVMIFLNGDIDRDRGRYAIERNLYSACAAEVATRFRLLFQSFRTVMSAQVMISAINTVLTAVFIFSAGLHHAAVLLGVTFLCGMLPLIGNLISNTIITGVAFAISPVLALAALAFLVLVHKLEYFLNSKIIGDRIRNPIWLTLFALVLGEYLMGIPGMVLAPVLLNYLKAEASSIEVKG